MQGEDALPRFIRRAGSRGRQTLSGRYSVRRGRRARNGAIASNLTMIHSSCGSGRQHANVSDLRTRPLYSVGITGANAHGEKEKAPPGELAGLGGVGLTAVLSRLRDQIRKSPHRPSSSNRLAKIGAVKLPDRRALSER